MNKYKGRYIKITRGMHKGLILHIHRYSGVQIQGDIIGARVFADEYLNGKLVYKMRDWFLEYKLRYMWKYLDKDEAMIEIL